MQYRTSPDDSFPARTLFLKYLFKLIIQYPHKDTREKLMQKRHFLSGATATMLKLRL